MFTTGYKYVVDNDNPSETGWYWADLKSKNPTWFGSFSSIEECFKHHDNLRKEELLCLGTVEPQ